MASNRIAECLLMIEPEVIGPMAGPFFDSCCVALTLTLTLFCGVTARNAGGWIHGSENGTLARMVRPASFTACTASRKRGGERNGSDGVAASARAQTISVA